jgi:RNA polymerase sigma-70 factor (ECF subfamily)
VQGLRDEELLANHLAEVPDAFDLLVRRHVDELFGFLLRFVGNAAAADDLVQETFLQVHLSAGSFDPSRSFRPWLYTIAANKARDFLRGRGRRSEQSLDSRGFDDDGPSPGQILEADEPAAYEKAGTEAVKEAVQALIPKMPEHLQLILVLGYYQQLPYAEIAEILDIPVGTVKSRLHSAITRFAKLWRSYQHSSPTGKPSDVNS